MILRAAVVVLAIMAVRRFGFEIIGWFIFALVIFYLYRILDEGPFQEDATAPDIWQADPWTCSECGAPNSSGFSCAECGASNPALSWICELCDRQNPGDVKVCPRCAGPRYQDLDAEDETSLRERILLRILRM